MKFTLATVLALAAAGATAAPSIVKRDGAAPTDAQILNFALTLEHLENAFYGDALKKFKSKDFTDDGFSPYVRGRLQQVADHEASHVKVIESVLTTMAGMPNQFVMPCKYKFPYSTPHEFTALSAVIENVGVSAYLGAAAAITDKGILTAAGSILTTEARHQAWINSVANKGTPWSGAYDAPLSINEVFTLAAGFIDLTSCPSDNAKFLPPLMAFPGLTFETKSLTPGKQAQFSFTAAQGGATPTSVAFTGTGGTVFAPITNSNMVVIPKGLQGTYYAVLTTVSSGAVTDETIQAGPAIINFGLPSNARQI